MNKSRISHKEAALSAFSRGEWKKALQSFQKHCNLEPTDLRSRLKVAELLERLGKKKEAIREYREVAEAYAGEGFLLQAISIHKMILRMDRSAEDIHERLNQLYSEKARETPSSRFLPRISFLSDLHEEELQSLLGHVRFRTFPQGSSLCRQGEPGDSLMVVQRGEVGVYKRLPNGKEVWIRNLGEGDCFGEFGFFLDRKRHADVRSLSECEVVEIHRNELEEIIQSHPHVKNVLQNLFEKRVMDLLLLLSPLFFPLTISERMEVLKRFRMVTLPEAAFVFKGGDPSHCLYLIKSGNVEIFTQDRSGKRVSLGRLETGHLFGEIGVLLNTPRMAFAQTTGPSELLELAKEDFDALLQMFPHLQSVVKEISSKRLVRMKETLSQRRVEETKECMV